MLDYKLCKSLKEAGFPQHYKKEDWYPGEVRIFAGDISYEPTLSELIKECGELSKTFYLNHDYEERQWCASAVPGYDEWITGKTPLEAVANLFLSLKKK